MDRDDKANGLGALLKKWKIGRWQAIVLAAGLIGLLLLCITSLPTGGKSAEGGINPAQESIRIDLTAYEQQLEERLCGIIGAIAGAGETRVMLTLECGSEPIYAVQGKTDSRHNISDSSTEEHISADKEYVIIGSGAGEQGLVLKMMEPQVRGVAVLGVGANKVSVAKMSGTN